MPVTLPVTLVDGVVPVANDFMQNYVALKNAIDALSVTGTVVPPGIVKGFAGAVVPTGWLSCDGAAVSRTSFSGLFAAIGTTWGVGDNTTTFNLPDLRGRALIGAGAGTGLTARTLAALLGEETHTLSAAEMPVHTHGVNDPGHVHPVQQSVSTPGSGPGLLAGSDVVGTTNAINIAGTGISIVAAGSGGAHNVVQPSAVIQWVIKT